MITVRELTLPMALELAANLGERDRAQVLQAHPDLDTWALERCTAPGIAWAILKDGEVHIACGVAKEGAVGTLWVVGRAGWQRYVKHVLRILREVKRVRLCEAFRCECLADNPVAQRFAERLGFVRRAAGDGRVFYGMAL